MEEFIRNSLNYFKSIVVLFFCLLALMLVESALAEPSVQLDPEVVKQEGFATSEEYEGVWQRVLPDGSQELKVFKDGHWAVKQHSAAGEDVAVYHGGSYVLPGDVFVETVDFVESGDTNLIGKSFVYRISVVEDVLKQSFVGGDATEIEWVRVEIEKSAPKASFSMGSIAMINVGTGNRGSSGSGFVVEMDGKKYLMTNQHVLDNMSSIEIKTLDNVQIRPVGFEISRKLDLVRLEITNDIPSLAIQQELPSIGDAVTVYGNSAGGGVATEIKGKVLGIGPDLIEVDAEFVEGNSGCPMLNANSEVLGVVSYATLYENAESMMSKDTRFQEIRRYGIRLNTDDWAAVSPKVFQEQARELSDQEQAVMMYAVTYLSFRNYINKPSRYTYRTIYDGNTRTTETVERDKEEYEKEYAYWKHIVDLFDSVRPDSDAYYSKDLYRKCASHYEKAATAFSSGRFDWRLARKGKLLLNLDSVRNLEGSLIELQEQRYLSQYLLNKSDKVVAICKYILELHGQK